MWIIGICLGIFILEEFFSVAFGSARAVLLFNRDWFNLSAENLMNGKVWTLFSYGFFHGTLMHLLVNTLFLFLIGRLLETAIGTQKLLLLFIASVISGGIIWAALHFNSNSSLVGASAGVVGMLIFFCLLNPNEPITLLLFFLFPVTLKRKWIAFVTVGIDGILFINELQVILNKAPLEHQSVAHSAHLGGALGGYLFFKWLYRSTAKRNRKQSRHTPELNPVETYVPSWTQKTVAAVTQKTRFKINMSNSADIRAEVDRILDKINSDGFGALTEDEKRVLDKAGKNL